MAGSVKVARMRHLRHRRLDGVTRGAEGADKGNPRLRRLEAWLAARADTAANDGIGDTAATTNFTADAANDEIDAAAHGLTTPAGPMVLTTTDTLPAGLATATLYWFNALTAGTLSVHRSRENAARGENAVAIGDAGTGTHSYARAADIPGLIEWLRQNNDSETIQALTDIDDL